MHSFHNTEANSIPKNNSFKKNPHRTPYFAVNAVAGGNYKTVTHRRLKDNIKTKKRKRENGALSCAEQTTNHQCRDCRQPTTERKEEKNWHFFFLMI